MTSLCLQRIVGLRPVPSRPTTAIDTLTHARTHTDTFESYRFVGGGGGVGRRAVNETSPVVAMPPN